MTPDSIAAYCRGVSKMYRRSSGETWALQEIDGNFPSGRVTALTGPSGSGKSSLLRIIAGLDRPTMGTVAVGDEDLSAMRARRRRKVRRSLVGYVFQRPSENLISYLTVREHMDLAAGIRGAERSESTEVLELLGIGHRLENRPHQLSGGEQQRLSFAMAAVGSPAIVVADEPTAELDTASAEALIRLLGRLAEKGVAVIVATHDENVARMADTAIRLEEGRIVGA